jgi:NAD(P)-dependent dehydrogenase (short-subunit alcohol dehydrogenase family)
MAEFLLGRGDHVVATVRDLQVLDDLSERYPGQLLALEFDVRELNRAPEIVSMAVEKFGRLDVLVNNAGYGLQGTVEELKMEQYREQMETNFFGLVAMTQAALPFMRVQKSGWVVNVSSMAGLRGSPTFGAYNASKFAVEGFTEALAAEMKPFGVQVTAVEPGPYRTDWAGSSLHRSEAMGEMKTESPYAQLNLEWKSMLDSRSGQQPGDPNQIASVLFEASRSAQIPVHMVFGDVAIQALKDRLPNYEPGDFFQYFPHDRYHF